MSELHSNCIYCGNSFLKELKSYSENELVKCNHCHLVFTRKIPAMEELVKHYDKYPRPQQLSELTKKRYHELLNKLEKFRSTNNLIDLGCSNGLFLQCAKEKGWQVYGTEFDPDCISYNEAKGIKVYKSDRLPDELFKIKFDVATSFEVFEHINDPLREMALINSLLRSGGALYITTPNFNSISRFYLKESWNIIEYPEHLTYYTPFTLNRLVFKFGYEEKMMLTTGFSISRFKKSRAGSNEVSEEIQNKDEDLRNKIEENKMLGFVKNVINFILTAFFIGDAMKALYVKK